MVNLSNSALHMVELEILARRSSPVHRLSALSKIISAFIYIISVISFPSGEISALTVYFLFPAVLIALADIPPAQIAKRALIALPFPLFAGLAGLFFDREAVFSLAGVPVSGGAIILFSILIKTLLSVSAVLLLVATTPFMELTDELERLRVPPVFIMVFTMIYRYISLLAEEAYTMYSAYILRSPGAKGIAFSHMGTFLGQLLLRSFDRAERVYLAMKLKGYNSFAERPQRPPQRGRDIAFMAAALILCAIFRLYNLPRILGGLFI